MDLEENQKQTLNGYISLVIYLNFCDPQFLLLPNGVNKEASYRLTLRITQDISKYKHMLNYK